MIQKAPCIPCEGLVLCKGTNEGAYKKERLGDVMKAVRVIDAICGAGKSTQMMNQIKESRKDVKWIYVSPYLTEVGDGKKKGRIHEECPSKDFQSPLSKGGKGNNLKELLKEGHNVAITHNLLLSIDFETVQLMKHYNIVIDETLDVVSVYEAFSWDDVRSLVALKWLLKADDGKLSWNTEMLGDRYNGVFNDIKALCDIDSLYLHRDEVLIKRPSVEMLKVVDSVTILTYMFEGSLMRYWMDMEGIAWTKIPLTTGVSPEEIKQRVRDNLIIRNTPKKLLTLNYKDNGEFEESAFASGWMDRNTDKHNIIKGVCESFLKRLSAEKVKYKAFWTTFKKHEEALAGQGYTQGSEITDDGVRLSPFVSKTTRATNDHADKNVGMYLVNVYAHGNVSSFLGAKGYKVNQEQLALSEMVQWLFRGCIRKGEPMYLLVASERMKRLLIEWLEQPE